MDMMFLLFKQNMIMFVYLLLGYFLYRKKLVGKQGSGDIGRMLLYVIMPVAIVKSYLAEFSMEMLEGLVVSFLAALSSLVLSIIVSRIAFKKEEAVERFGAAFSNAGFIGIPLVQMTLGAEAVFYVSSFVALLNILQWTYGVLTITGDPSVVSFRKIRTNPIVISFVAGLCLFFLPVSLPDMLQSMIGTVASMNGPLAMIVLGTYLAQIPLKTIFTEKIVYRCTVVRLIVIPVLTIPLLMLFPAKYHLIQLTVLIAASAPVGSNVAIFAQLYDKDYTRAVKEVCMSTLFCVVTLPIILGIANYIL
ncbi:AEC family transporter [Anaerobium acetethylicum]|uniref:AEC family transporter n=1 Tax=Anaerobium acetethylicum TaxID=1619234 RepID=A0A1D3TVQ3_9FIRM|nr:AEC family transporter [Anaerobium acetethylicum]SCP98221.1 hypothetical protein SAMN05421730_101811 [Anaerobium acetethylicum]